MASKMHSARYEYTKGTCGHDVMFFVPPGNIGVVGRRNMAAGQGLLCPKCAAEQASEPSAEEATMAVATTTITVPAGTIVLYHRNLQSMVHEFPFTLRRDVTVEATRLDDGRWGFTHKRRVYSCAGGSAILRRFTFLAPATS